MIGKYLLITTLIILLALVFLFYHRWDLVNKEKRSLYGNQPLEDLSQSPSREQAIFIHRPNSKNSDELSIIVTNKNKNKFQKIFHTKFASWDMTSDPQWIGNNHLFFLRHCGTSCQGITLLNIKTGKTENATLSYPTQKGEPAITHFKDWFGQEFELKGLLYKIYREIIDDKPYLIFEMKNSEGKQINQEKFLFTNQALILET